MTECKRCLMGTDIDSVVLDGDGICQYCRMHERLDKAEPVSKARERALAKRVRVSGVGKKYDCIVGVSGGSDSSFLLYWAKKMGLRPLAVHFDNGWNTPEAESNMRVMAEQLRIDLYIERAPAEYGDMNRAFLKAGVPEADVPNDILLLLCLLNAAKCWGVKYILNGHNFRTEGTSPLAWTLMDSRYMQDVYRRYTGKELPLKLMTFFEQVKYRFSGITTLRPMYCIGSTKEENKAVLGYLGWKDYGGIHTENVYTAFVGSYLLPRKFGIDKRRTYLSAAIRSGKLSKREARRALIAQMEYPESWLKRIETEYLNGILKGWTMDKVMSGPVRTPGRYGDYYGTYARFGWLFRLGILVGMFPKTFEKYITESSTILRRRGGRG